MPSLIQELAGIAKRARTEVHEREREIEKAKKHVQKAAEDRRLAALAQQAKKKNTKKGKKKDEEEEEAPKAVLEVKSEADDGPPNLHDNKQYLGALKKTWPRPFTFGPIRFSDLNVEDVDVAAIGE
jgi:hypothetical protein